MDVDARTREANALAAQARALTWERRRERAIGADDPMAGHARIAALEHHVADRARRTRAPGDQRDEAVARDAAAWDVTHDLIHA